MTHSRFIAHLLEPLNGPTRSSARARPTQARQTQTRCGFSLVELMVVVVIVGVLVAAGAVASLIAINKAAQQQTHVALQALAGIAAEYEAQTGVVISDTDPNPPDDSIERFVFTAKQLPTTAAMLASINKDLLIDSDLDGDVEVVDGWGRKLNYYDIASGPKTSRPYFASTGRDGELDPDPYDIDKGDDIYSDDLE